MRLIKTIIITILVVGLAALIFTAFYVKSNGRFLLQTALSHGLNREVFIEDVRFQFPLGISAYDFYIENLLEAQQVHVQFDLSTWFKKSITIKKAVLVEPVFAWESGKGEKDGASAAMGVPSGDVKPGGMAMGLVFKEIKIQDGTFEHKNEISGAFVPFSIENIQGTVENARIPFDGAQAAFRLSGNWVMDDKPLSGSRVNASGWIDWKGKNMEAKIDVVEPDGKLGLTADLAAVQNALRVQGNVRLSHLLLGWNSQEGQGEVNQMLIKSLSSQGIELGAQFNFDTQLDAPKIDKISFSGDLATTPSQDIPASE